MIAAPACCSCHLILLADELQAAVGRSSGEDRRLVEVQWCRRLVLGRGELVWSQLARPR
jgi:hypothetical protein